jgi:hypothetical protein
MAQAFDFPIETDGDQATPPFGVHFNWFPLSGSRSGSDPSAGSSSSNMGRLSGGRKRADRCLTRVSSPYCGAGDRVEISQYRRVLQNKTASRSGPLAANSGFFRREPAAAAEITARSSS